MSNPDQPSRVPRYTFSDTPAEQEAELEANPLLRRMVASRKAKSGDPHRPFYHYVNPENTLNDPNGLCFWQGRWHLFYQGYPPEETRVHWGHAVSDDLIHWRDLPYAIYPGAERDCYSGATLVEEDRVIAMYHGTQAGNMVAVSSDPLLLNWEKVTRRPVIPIPEQDGSPQPYTVFDPCIWKKDGSYYALSAGTLVDEPGGKRSAADFLFRSDDLASWEYLHPFTEGDRFTLVGDDGACPYFWPIGGKHILPFFSHMSGGQYLLGDYDTERDKLVATSAGLFNFGAALPSGVHAPSATPDGQGGRHRHLQHEPGIPYRGLEPDHDATQASHAGRRRRAEDGACGRHRVPPVRPQAHRRDDAARQRGGGAGGRRGQVDGADDRARPQGSAHGRAERPPVARQGGAHPDSLLQGPGFRRPGSGRPAGGVAPEASRSLRESADPRFVLLIDPPRRALPPPGDGAGAP